jgi:epoxyqueuosine reductase
MSEKPRVLLHICCAPDSTAVFERLKDDYQVLGYFHNPNIYPPEEYARRLREAERVSQAMGFDWVPSEYSPETWEAAVVGLETEPETGLRCGVCFKHNLGATAAKAHALGIAVFATTLTISPHKSSSRIFSVGREAGQAHGVKFLEFDFKKKDGFKRSLELSRSLSLYRQHYCGCRYSLRGTSRA